MDITLLSIKDFESQLNQFFKIQISPELQLNAQLIEVTELKNYSQMARTPFSVVFRTEQKNEYYEQGIFTVIHPQKGNFDLFLS